MTPRHAHNRTAGYILVDATVAMIVLSAGIVAIQSGMRQTLHLRGLARDYTEARFLLESLVAELGLQAKHAEHSKSGRFPGEHSRFRWHYTVSRSEVPKPRIPPDMPPDQVRVLNSAFLTRITVTISWTRGDEEYEETAETLLSPNRLFLPEEEMLRYRRGNY